MAIATDYIPGRVSVVIISFNYGHFIEDAIHSALSQDIDDLEVIVVDDGSTDGTGEIIRAYKDRVKYIFQKNAGQSAARNKGLENSSGEFIQFLDSDDMLGSGKIQTQLNYFQSHPGVSIVVCPTKFFKKKDSKNGRPIAKGSWYLFKDNLEIYLCFYNIAPPHAFLYRREVFVQTGMLDSSVDNCEDYDFLLRAACKGYIPKYTPDCIVYYRKHSNSVTAHSTRQYLTDVKMHQRLAELLQKDPTFPGKHRLEGLLAFCAGAVKTAQRLYSLEPQKSNELLKLADKHMQRAKNLAKIYDHDWNFHLKLFCLNILNSLSIPCFKRNPLAMRICVNLSKVLKSVQAPNTRVGLAIDSIRFAFDRRHRYFLERLLIGHLSLKYAGKLLLPSTYRLNPLD